MIGLSYYQLFLLVSSFQGLLLTIFLIIGNHHRNANRWLILLTFSWSFTCFIYALQSYVFFYQYPHIFFVGTAVTLLYFPPLFLYVKYLVNPDKKVTKNDLIHFLPFILFVLLNLDFYILPAETKRYYVANFAQFQEEYGIRTIIHSIVLIVQGFIYSWMSLRYIKIHDEALRSYFSDIEDAALDWLKTLIWTIVVLWSIGSFGSIMETLGYSGWEDVFDVFYLLLAICIYMVVYMALRQPEIITDFSRKATKSLEEAVTYASKLEKGKKVPVHAHEDIVHENNAGDVNTLEEVQYDVPSDESHDLNAQKVLKFMKEDKPYLDRRLNLQSLADMLDMHRHYLSYIINNQMGVNFHVFVNQYRVDEAKEKLLSAEFQDYKLEYLAVEAGFNSKSSFNRIFKSTTGQTPGEFKKAMLGDDA